MIDRALVKRVLTIRSVRPAIIVVTGAASIVGMLSALIQGWPLWGIVLVALLPWIPLLGAEIAWTYRHYTWLALYYVLVITQGGHVLEHVAQMVQLHLLDLKGASARGVFGALDIEWVHFTWNTWVLTAVALLLWRFPRNSWLWVTAVLAGWHETEHIVIMTRFLSTGQAGTPGLLATGGAVAGGLPLTRPDLHFVYNVVETTPLIIGFVYQLRSSYDAWLKRALPALSEPLLREATQTMKTLHFSPGDTIIREGDQPDRFYVICRGEVVITRAAANGPAELRTLSAGQFFGEVGLLAGIPRTASVRAKTSVEVLAMDRDLFASILDRSQATAEQLAQVMRDRLAPTIAASGT